MISPNTAPGTKVKIISDPWDLVPRFSILGFDIPYFMRRVSNEHEIGTVLTVNHIKADDQANSGFYAYFSDYEDGLCLEVLSYVELPRAITEALKTQPLIPDSEKQRANADARDREHFRQFLPFD